MGLFWSPAKLSLTLLSFTRLAWQFSTGPFNKLHLLPFSLAAIHRNSPRPVKVPRCHSDPPNPHLIIPTPEGFRYLVLCLSSHLFCGFFSGVHANILKATGRLL